MQTLRAQPDYMHIIEGTLQTQRRMIEQARAANGFVSMPQLAADESFKLPDAFSAPARDYGRYQPPGPQDDAQGLTRVGGYPTDPPARLKGKNGDKVSAVLAALKNESWNNLMMSTLTAVGYTGISYGADAFLTPTPKAVEAAEKKVEVAEKALEKADEKKVEAAERKVEVAEKSLEKVLMKTSGKSLVSSKKGGIAANGISQLGISMGVRTLATCASASSTTFQKNVKYITPLVSGGLRGVVDYYVLGKSIGRTATDSMVVAGLEYLSTQVVMGYN